MVGISAVAALCWTLGPAQYGRQSLVQLDKLPAWAGGRPEVVACEAYAKAGLSTPSSYQRVDLIVLDSERLTPEQLDRELASERDAQKGRDAASDHLQDLVAQLDRYEAGQRDVRFRKVGVKYDSSNAAGVTERGAQVCAFRLVDGVVRLDPAARAIANRPLDHDLSLEFFHSRGWKRNDGRDCCL